MTKNLQDTGERMVPEFHKGKLMYAEHITRYISASPLVAGKTVLDIASGSGYGSDILARSAKKVIGVDINGDAVAYAQTNFRRKNLEFKEGSGTEIPVADNSVDVVVTFETIEHIEDYDTFMKEIGRVLKPDGIAIISTPNDIEFPEGAHYHVHEFKYKELLKLVEKYFKYVDPYFQATWRYVAVGNNSFFANEWDKDLRTLNLATLDESKYLYFYLVCSNKEIATKLKPLAATGEHHSDRQIISSWSNINFEVERRQKHIDELYMLIEKTNEQKRIIEAELDQIKNSKSYATALKLSRLKGRVKRG
jgi:ubiquinone/menaquinone biosynthesis C-methylase UbiE